MSERAALHASARARVVALAAERLSTLAEDLVPPPVRPYRRFTPRKRAQLAAVPLALALENDPAFRRLVADGVPAELAAALREGRALPAVPPEELAAAAYLVRPEGWEALVARADDALQQRDRTAAGAASVDTVARLTEQLEALRAQAREQAARLTAELEAAQAELVVLRRRVRDAASRAADAERALAAARLPAGPPAVAPPGPGPEDGGGEVRRLRARLRAAEQGLADARTAARAGARDDRHGEQVRLRVLLDALVGAAGGLRRELALPPLEQRPADAVAERYASEPVAPGRALDDPALLDALLLAPAVHLLVDGYNVTKTGYGELTLEQQRTRLTSGLGALAARTGAEVTAVFDGAAQESARAALAVRGVRVLFSPAGVIADDVLRELVGAEPAGRPLVVVSSDREVADDVRRLGATAVASRALLVLLAR